MLLPSATVFLLLLCNDKEVLGPWVNRPWLNVLAGLIVAVLLALSLILMATTVFPNLDVDLVALVLGAIIVAAFLAVGVWALLPAQRQAPRRRPTPRPPSASPQFGARPGACLSLPSSSDPSGRAGAAVRCGPSASTSSWPWSSSS